MKRSILGFLSLSLLCFILNGCSVNEPTTAAVNTENSYLSALSLSTGSTVNMEMGNPSDAASSTSYSNNYLQDETYFTLSYNSSKVEANWVSWRLTISDMGSASRPSSFHTDTFLPSSFNLAFNSDWTSTGFDRGHMCDAADRAANSTSILATFTCANIVPQSPICNQQTWEQLEAYCRSLASAGNTLYMCSGPYGSGGDGSDGSATKIGTHNVVVPSKVWKVIMVIPGTASTTDYTKVTSSTRLIAVIMPNSQSITTGTDAWKKYRVSVNSVESLTGYTFFSKVNSSIITPLKAKVDNL